MSDNISKGTLQSLVGKLVVHLESAEFTRDRRILLHMNPWIRITVGELHMHDSKVIIRGGKNPDFFLQ